MGTSGSYRISTNQLDVVADGDIYWGSQLMGASQEIYVTVVIVDPAGAEMDLLLKSQRSDTWTAGLVEVWYDAANRRAQVWTYAPSQGWVQQGADIPVTLANGDRFGARALSTGVVEIYHNGVLKGSASVASWPFISNGGYIGLWTVAAGSTIFDDFGGGSLP